MFAALVFERDPLTLSDLFTGKQLLLSWVQTAGGFAAAGLVVWLIVHLCGGTRLDTSRLPSLLVTAFVALLVGAGVAYAAYFVLLAVSGGAPTPRVLRLRDWALGVGGFFALAAVLLPFLFDLVNKISFKDLVPRRVLYVFSILLLVMLFAIFDVPYTYGQFVYWVVMTPLLLLAADVVPRRVLFVVSVLLFVLLFASWDVPNYTYVQLVLTIVQFVCWVVMTPLLLLAADVVPRRVLYVFSILLLVLLFASWFVPYTSVQFVYWVLMTPLLLLAADVVKISSKFRARRIFAVAKLSFKEAVRRRVLYVFSLLLLVFLFASWFVPYKPEKQVSTYVYVVYWSMTPLLLITAVILAAFSIPTDVKNQTIHTVLTKPIERFEVVLGRFLGYVALMTVVLAVMAGVSLLYVLRGVEPEAAEESLKARQAFYGTLTFENTSVSGRGDYVGREWEYRSYITAPGAGQRPQTAVWSFPPLPEYVAKRDVVRCEVTFDIYRTTKGEEDRRPACNFVFQTWRFGEQGLSVTQYQALRREELEKERRKPAGEPRRSDLEIDNELAEKYGYYEVPSRGIVDYHTLAVDVPGGLFRNARGSDGKATRPDAVTVRVQCHTPAQYVGMAKNDLYLRLDDPRGGADQARFAVNFFKGATGLWCRLALVIGVAVALSAYFSGVISLLIALLLYLGGLCRDFILSVGSGTNFGGGPLESLFRIASRQALAAPLEEGPTKTITLKSDAFFRWVFRVVSHVIPDVERFDLTDFVAEGFNFSLAGWHEASVLMNLLLLSGYLLLWFVLAYYTMKWREVAAAT
jgi:hypothetical protein